MKQFLQFSIRSAFFLSILFSFSQAHAQHNVDIWDGPNSMNCGDSERYKVETYTYYYWTHYTWTVTYPDGSQTSERFAHPAGQSYYVDAGGQLGNITIEVLAEDELFNNSASDTKSVSIQAGSNLPQPGYISGTHHTCNGSTQTYSIAAVSGADRYRWVAPVGCTIVGHIPSNPRVAYTYGNDRDVQVVRPASGYGYGSLQVRAETASGCRPASAYKNRTIVWGSVNENISGRTEMPPGEEAFYSISVTGKSNFSWSATGGMTITPSSDINSHSITAEAGFSQTWGSVSVSYTSCGVNYTKYLNVNITYDTWLREENTTESELDGSEGLSIFPNPAEGAFTIQSAENIKQVSIFDQMGRMVLTATPNQARTTLEVNELKEGIYFVHIQGESGETTVEKLILN